MKIPSTMPEQVSLIKELEISYRNLHPTGMIINSDSNVNIIIPFSSITNKYRHFLQQVVITVELNEEEQLYYLYKPKLLSEDLYDTTELWNDILILNNNISVSEFKPKRVKVYDPNRLKLLLNEVMIIEERLGNIKF